MLKRKIILSVSTMGNDNWAKQIEQIKEMGLKEFGLFLTGLREKSERELLYKQLEEMKDIEIPHVHLLSNMETEELSMFCEHYNTQVFNTHSIAKYPLEFDPEPFKEQIYIENGFYETNERELESFAGLCLDLSHLENDRLLRPETYNRFLELIKKYRIGVNHISGIAKEPYQDVDHLAYDLHELTDYHQIDYLTSFPIDYFAPFMAIELRNPPIEQIEIKKYIISILSKKFGGVEIT
jgi:hypothetical protein